MHLRTTFPRWKDESLSASFVKFYFYFILQPVRHGFEGYCRLGAQLWLLNFCRPSYKTLLERGSFNYAMNSSFTSREKSVGTLAREHDYAYQLRVRDVLFKWTKYSKNGTRIDWYFAVATYFKPYVYFKYILKNMTRNTYCNKLTRKISMIARWHLLYGFPINFSRSNKYFRM